ncbi:MAG: signal peptidase II [Candidatus Oxydemutatoraceae bacterium WSBS_2016_MAG_OTU14]
MRKYLWLSAIVVVIDQITKIIASNMLHLHEAVALVPYLNLTLVHNQGASFGLLSEAGGWQRWFLIAVAVAISLYLYTWLVRLGSESTWTAAGLSLIIGGAFGNLIDRMWQGYVVDFIDVYYGAYHWPVFNVSDMAISLGALAVVIGALGLAEEI